MPEEDQKLTLSIVEALKNKGFTQSEIAKQYNVTKQYVSWIKRTYGGSLTPREIVLQEFPWAVSNHFTQTSPYQRLRDHGEYVATGGKGMAEYKLERLRAFYKKLHTGYVIEFDPDIPASESMTKRGGFALRDRTPEDGDLLIRVNDHTTLTDKGKMIWRFPAVEP
ncbi:XRE family transcriptional regulator [Nocardia sp. NPDC055002]